MTTTTIEKRQSPVSTLKVLLTLVVGVSLGAAGLLVADQVLSDRQPTPSEDQPSGGARLSDVAPPPHRKETFERIPNVWLTTHEGKRVRFYDDLVKGKIVAINFFYSACTEF